MALILQATAVPNQASDSIVFTELTGVYDAINNPGGFGAPNPAVAANIVTEFIPTYVDGTVGSTITLDGTTIPTSLWVPRNALVRQFTIPQIGLTGDEFETGVMQLIYRPWFTTTSGGIVGVTLGSPTVTRQAGQDFTVDFANTSMIRLNGVNYTILSKTISTITLTTNYTGATVLNATAYQGYQITIGVILDRAFKVCFFPRYIANRTGTCNKPLYQTLVKLKYQWDAVYALAAIPSFSDANTLLQHITRDCTCLSNTNNVAGCASCL